MKTYLVAAVKPWNIQAYHRYADKLPGRWLLITQPEELDAQRVRELAPRYIFFPHWSWVVPGEIFEAVECVCFHMADVPYGRGGSPLQNLIANGHRTTMMSALRMVRELDAGPVYLKQPLTLDGRAQDIYERAAEQVWAMIKEIVDTEPEPVAQRGEVVVFKRRTPEQSRLPEAGTLEELFDHIRMLDAESYPHAFLEYGDWRLEFSHAGEAGEAIQATVTIKSKRTTQMDTDKHK